MTALRRLSYGALAVAFLQIVFGAIVRISGSGWGCGEHWPKCDGQWVPPFAGAQLIVEVSHRYGALLTTSFVVALVILAWRRRALAGVGARGGVLRSAALALGIVVVTALFGMITIKLRLDPRVIVGHFILAISLLATLIVTVTRAGGFGATRAVPLSADAVAIAAATRSWRVARIAVVLAFLVLVLGALTANLGAGGACLGFPTCRVFRSDNSGLVHLQLTHRILAFLFALHVLGAAMMIRRRPVAVVVKRAAWTALGAVVLQILVAAALVELRLPSALRSLHEAVGVLVWIAIVVYATLAWRAGGREPARLVAPLPDPGAGSLRRREGSAVGASATVTTPPSVAVIGEEPEVNARLADIERAARAYESAMSALVAEAEAAAGDPEAVSVEPAADAPPSEAPSADAPATDAPAVDAPVAAPTLAAADPAPPAAEPTIETNYALYVNNCTAVGEVPPDAVVPPEARATPGTEPAAESVAAPEAAPPPVTLPEGVVTPAQPTPAAPPKRPHSVAVIVARGADF